MTDLDKIDKKLEGIFTKLDLIIERNSNADKHIAVLQEKIDTHSQQDDKVFVNIAKKHEGYDRFILGSLVWAIGQLIGLILIMAFK